MTKVGDTGNTFTDDLRKTLRRAIRRDRPFIAAQRQRLVELTAWLVQHRTLAEDWRPTPDLFDRLAKDPAYRKFARGNDHIILKTHLAMMLWEVAAQVKVLRDENGTLSPEQLGRKMDPVIDADMVS